MGLLMAMKARFGDVPVRGGAAIACAVLFAMRLLVPDLGGEPWFVAAQQFAIGTLVTAVIGHFVNQAAAHPSVLLSVDEVVDWPALVRRLVQGQDPPSRYWWNQLDPATRERLQRGLNPSLWDIKTRRAVVDGINRSLRLDAWHEMDAFTMKDQSREIAQLARQRSVPQSVLNRWLLERSFPREISDRLGLPSDLRAARTAPEWSAASYLAAPAQWGKRQRLLALVLGTGLVGSWLAYSALNGQFHQNGGWFLLPFTLLGPALFICRGSASNETP